MSNDGNAEDDDQTAYEQAGAKAVGGDDERENREQIEATGEPNRDAMGNADGAS